MFPFQYGRAPIHWASARGNIEIMEMLLNAHCDIEARDKVRKMYIKTALGLEQKVLKFQHCRFLQ